MNKGVSLYTSNGVKIDMKHIKNLEHDDGLLNSLYQRSFSGSKKMVPRTHYKWRKNSEVSSATWREQEI